MSLSEAATDALEIDAHDGKALYRRAQAHLHLGDVTAAKNDYVSILKSSFCSTESKMSARDGLQHIRQIVSKWKSDVSRIMQETTSQVSQEFATEACCFSSEYV